MDSKDPSQTVWLLRLIWAFIVRIYPDTLSQDVDQMYVPSYRVQTFYNLGSVVQSVVSLTSSLTVISLTILADSIYNILIFLLKKCEELLHCKSYPHFFSKKFPHICVSLDVNFNESLTNDIFTFEHLGPEIQFKQKRGLKMIKLSIWTHFKATLWKERKKVRR